MRALTEFVLWKYSSIYQHNSSTVIILEIFIFNGSPNVEWLLKQLFSMMFYTETLQQTSFVPGIHFMDVQVGL